MGRVHIEETAEEEHEDHEDATYRVNVRRNRLTEFMPGTRKWRLGVERFNPSYRLESVEEEYDVEIEEERGRAFQGMYLFREPFSFTVHFPEDADSDYREEVRERIESEMQRWIDKYEKGLDPARSPGER